MAKDPLTYQPVSTNKQAEELSDILGCSGSHQISENEWGPCESFGDLQKLIKLGNPAFREWKERQSGKKSVGEVLRMKAERAGKLFKTQSEAETAASRLGCSGAHQARQGASFTISGSRDQVEIPLTMNSGRDRNVGGRAR